MINAEAKNAKPRAIINLAILFILEFLDQQ